MAVNTQITHSHCKIIPEHPVKSRSFLSRSEKLFLPDFFFGKKQKRIAKIFPEFFFKLLLFLLFYKEIHRSRLQAQSAFQTFRYFRVILYRHTAGIHMPVISRHDHQCIGKLLRQLLYLFFQLP